MRIDTVHTVFRNFSELSVAAVSADLGPIMDESPVHRRQSGVLPRDQRRGDDTRDKEREKQR